MKNWIDINEQKPNDGQLCLVKYEVWRFHSLWYKDEGEFKYIHEPLFGEIIGGFEHGFEDCHIEFTHWKPIKKTIKMKKQKQINYLQGREKYLTDKTNKIMEKDFEIVLSILNKYGIVDECMEIKNESRVHSFKLTRYE